MNKCDIRSSEEKEMKGDNIIYDSIKLKVVKVTEGDTFGGHKNVSL